MIIPKPAMQTAEEGVFAFSSHITVYVSFSADPGYSHFVAEELSQKLRVATGSFVSVKSAEPGEAPAGGVVLTDHEALEGLGDEGYNLTVRPDRITLRAPAAPGLFYAGQSLAQLIHHRLSTVGKNGGGLLSQLPCVTIQDEPRFAWRGFMLDSARHFQPIELILKLIDQIAALKLNRFHWHLTEDQGWRLEVLSYPKLTGVGAWRSNGDGHYGGFYTQEQVRDVIVYAKLRNVTVIPEIEMPAHNLAALAAYPELGCSGERTDVTNDWGVLAGVFCAGRDETFSFLENVLNEVAELFPAAYLHIGGDERKQGLWDNCPRCQGVRKEHGLADESALQKWFMDRVADHIHTTLGRRTIAWGDNIDAGVTEGQVVQGWLPEQSAKAARQGSDTINSTHEWVYLDYPATEQDLAEKKPDWMMVLPLEKVYRFDPIPQGLEPEHHHHVLGSESHLWTEHVPNEKELYHQLIPRLLAFAETVWSPLDLRDFDCFKKRLAVQQGYLFPG